jgi:hypothetical protein
MMQIKVMTIEDYEAISIHGKHWWKGRVPASFMAQSYLDGGPALSFFWKGKLVMVGGIVSPWPRSGEAWAILAPEASECVVSLNRSVRRVVHGFRRGMGLNRLQAHVEEGFHKGNRWATWMGFKEEGRMPKFGPEGETFVRYVILEE